MCVGTMTLYVWVTCTYEEIMCVWVYMYEEIMCVWVYMYEEIMCVWVYMYEENHVCVGIHV